MRYSSAQVSHQKGHSIALMKWPFNDGINERDYQSTLVPLLLNQFTVHHAVDMLIIGTNERCRGLPEK